MQSCRKLQRSDLCMPICRWRKWLCSGLEQMTIRWWTHGIYHSLERTLPRWSDPLLGFVIKCSRSVAPSLNALSWKVGVGVAPSLCVWFMVQILLGWPDLLLYCAPITRDQSHQVHSGDNDSTLVVSVNFLLQLCFKWLPVIYNYFLTASCVLTFWNFSVCNLLDDVQHCHHFVECPVMVISQDHCVAQINHECVSAT